LPTAIAAENVLVAVRRGDDDAVTQFVTAHQHGVYSYVRAMIGDAPDAEEVAQDTFVRAIHAIRNQYSSDQVQTLQARSWLLRIARNLALNRLRARRSRPRTDPIEDGQEFADRTSLDSGDGGDDSERLERGLRSLDWSMREWIDLRFVQELTYAEIAAIKGGTEAAARGKVFRALASLKQLCSEDIHAEM
jgi:RNA polymerase sigma-70 factor (ECF subfamily)